MRFLGSIEDTYGNEDLVQSFVSVKHLTRKEVLNQIFGNNFFSRYFGGAGFNRHLLHHLDPSISSTRFDEFEEFLMRSSCAAEINKCRSTYWTKFKELFYW